MTVLTRGQFGRPATTAATCPLCRTAHATLTDADVTGGAEWRCVTCYQYWRLARLTTVAEYGKWERARSESAVVQHAGLAAGR